LCKYFRPCISSAVSVSFAIIKFLGCKDNVFSQVIKQLFQFSITPKIEKSTNQKVCGSHDLNNC
jgi:hypothetical protein